MFGAPQFVWLKTFEASTRTSAIVFPIGNWRKRERSRFQTPGRRNLFRPLLPKPATVAPVGCENFDGSYHASVSDPAVPLGL